MFNKRYAGKEEPEERGDSVEQEKKDVEVSVNGQGPSVKFRIGLAAMIQVVITLITLGGASVILRADVDRLSAEQAKNTGMNERILTEVTELKTVVSYLRDEVRYYRERIDKIQAQQGRRGQQ